MSKSRKVLLSTLLIAVIALVAGWIYFLTVPPPVKIGSSIEQVMALKGNLTRIVLGKYLPDC